MTENKTDLSENEISPQPYAAAKVWSFYIRYKQTAFLSSFVIYSNKVLWIVLLKSEINNMKEENTGVKPRFHYFSLLWIYFT